MGPSQRLKKLTGALSCVHKAPKCIQSLWDHPKTIPFVQKHKEDAICAILREKTPFWGIPRGSKKLIVIYALCCKAAQLSQIIQIPSGPSEKKFLLCKSTKKSRYVDPKVEKTPFWGHSQRLKKLTGAAQLRAQSSQKIQIPLGPSEKKFLLCKNTKKTAICAILREKTPFWGIPRGSKRCCYLRNLSAQGCALSHNNANPSGLSEKKVYCVESLRFCR